MSRRISTDIDVSVPAQNRAESGDGGTGDEGAAMPREERGVVAFSASVLRAIDATASPRAPKTCAQARPTPLDAPVIATVFASL